MPRAGPQAQATKPVTQGTGSIANKWDFVQGTSSLSPNWQDGALQGRKHWHAAQRNRERLVVQDRQRTLKDLHTQTIKSTSKIAVRDHRDISLRKTKQRPPRTWSSARAHIIWEPNPEGQEILDSYQGEEHICKVLRTT